MCQFRVRGWAVSHLIWPRACVSLPLLLLPLRSFLFSPWLWNLAEKQICPLGSGSACLFVEVRQGNRGGCQDLPRCWEICVSLPSPLSMDIDRGNWPPRHFGPRFSPLQSLPVWHDSAFSPFPQLLLCHIFTFLTSFSLCLCDCGVAEHWVPQERGQSWGCLLHALFRVLLCSWLCSLNSWLTGNKCGWTAPAQCELAMVSVLLVHLLQLLNFNYAFQFSGDVATSKFSGKVPCLQDFAMVSPISDFTSWSLSSHLWIFGLSTFSPFCGVFGEKEEKGVVPSVSNVEGSAAGWAKRKSS